MTTMKVKLTSEAVCSVQLLNNYFHIYTYIYIYFEFIAYISYLYWWEDNPNSNTMKQTLYRPNSNHSIKIIFNQKNSNSPVDDYVIRNQSIYSEDINGPGIIISVNH